MIGKTISHYKILKKLGEGGMGVVYKAEDTKIKRTVALKFLPPELTRDPEAKKRFIHEARAASALDHPNICTIHEIGEVPIEGREQTFIVMALYEGDTLKTQISRQPMNLDEVIHIALQVVDGLFEAHEKGIVHRDVKSENLMVTRKNHVRIMDFGLAKLEGRTKLTKTGMTLGTPSYMSPEQARGSEVDHRSDIWSVGVVLYEMLTGRLPFQGDYEQAVVYSILQEDPEPVAALRSGIPVEFEAIVNKCLEKDPANRYQHVSELGVDLKRLQKKLKVDVSHVKNAPSPGTKRFRGIIAAVIATCVILTGATYLSFKFRHSTEQFGSRIIAKTEWENSIAVLPFRYFSPQKDQEHFCFGMTDAINDRLARLGVLKVSSTTSVMRYKETKLDIRDIGRELGVAHILEGSVQVENERIRVRGQLINAETNFHVWSDTYERELESIFEVQDEVSQAIAEALKIELTPENVESLTRERPESMEAYEYYLKGMHLFNQFVISFKDEDFRESENMFREALKIHPDYALAYVGLAWIYLHHSTWTGEIESSQKGVRCSDIAYKLGPDIGSAIALKGYIYRGAGDFENAFSLFRMALSVNPNGSMIQALVGYSLRQLGLYTSAKGHLNKAGDLNPFYTVPFEALFMAYYMMGEYDKSIPFLNKMVKMSPEIPFHPEQRAIALVMTDQFERADSLLTYWEQVEIQSSAIHRGKAYLFAVQGKRDEALALAKTDMVYLALGMEEEAIAYMKENMQSHRSYPYLHLKYNPIFDALRDNAEFKHIVENRKLIYNRILKAAKGL